MELLIVVAILAILIAFLIAGIQRWRESAMGLQNMNNHRQIASALLAYAAENNSVLPYAYDNRTLDGQRATTRRAAYPRILVYFGHVTDPRIFFNPRAGRWYENYQSTLNNPASQAIVPWFYSNYGANRYGAMPMQGQPLDSGNPPQDGNRRPANLSRVAADGNLSKLILLRDVFDGRDDRDWIPDADDNRGGGRIEFSQNRLLPPPRFQYGGRVHVSFADGHVQAIDADELREMVDNSVRGEAPLFHDYYTRP